MDYQNLKRKSDHVKGGPFLVLLPSMLCRAKEKDILGAPHFKKIRKALKELYEKNKVQEKSI